MLTELLPLTSEAVSIHLNMKTKHVGVYSAFFVVVVCLFVLTSSFLFWMS